MTSTSGSINYRGSFEIPVLTKIHGEPNADSLIVLQRELKANASSIYSNLGGATHGHLFLVIPPAQFNLLTNAPFVRPNHPGLLTIPVGTTAAMSAVLKDTHTEHLRLFREVHGVEKALISQIVSAVDTEYLNALRNRATNAIPGPVHLILDYLKNTYGKVTPQLLDEKETLLRAMTYTPSAPIDTIFTAVDDVADYAELGGATMTQNQCITKAYLILNKGGQLKEEMKTWNRLPELQKTWIAFKIHFRRAHNEYRETTNTTLQEATRQLENANLVQQVIEGVRANMPEQENQDIAIEVANIASQVSQSQEVIPQLITQIHQMQAMMNQMHCQLTNNGTPGPPPFVQPPPAYVPPPPPHQHQQPPYNQQYQQEQLPGWMIGGRGRGGRGRGRGGGRAAGRAAGQGRGNRRFDRPMTYCWTHGNCYHNSGTCNSPAQGHQQAATFQNRLGGNHRNCG